MPLFWLGGHVPVPVSDHSEAGMLLPPAKAGLGFPCSRALEPAYRDVFEKKEENRRWQRWDKENSETIDYCHFCE